MADNGQTLDAETIEIVLRVCRLIGAGSPKYSNLLILSVIEKYTDFITSVNYTFTPDDLIQQFGTRPQDAAILIEDLGGMENMAVFLPTIFGARDLLPHPESTPIIVPLFIIFASVTSTAIILRLWSRHRIAGGLNLFDYLTVVSYLMTLIWGAVALHHSRINGKYVAYWDRSWDSLREHYKIYLALTALYPWVMATIKMSLLVFYYQMSNLRVIKWCVIATGVITIANTFAGFLFVIFTCNPVAWWDDLLQNPCIDQRAGLIITGAIYILTDVAIWVLPMPLVFRLKLRTRERLLAILTFGIGAALVQLGID
ncbi:hypothetical protein TWF694_009387 [Orbilia ellipsospora]|uniref:Rhodopsin domain-containing protein n=1 Tax=Orbilia ellipsospora TaxID=2528407 RepID=A0AAV9XB48_9PEZI